MGGRGASSSSGKTKSTSKEQAKAVIVEINGTTLSYRDYGGTVTDLERSQTMEIGDLSFKDVVERVSDNPNAKITYLSQKQLKTYDERKEHNRKIEEEYLNTVAGMYQGGVVYKKKGGVKKTKSKTITFEQFLKQHKYKYYDKLY